MGKKPGDKGREWEKERRDKLNASFNELSKLLPEYDPSMSMSKMEILRKAADYIKYLQEKNNEIIICGRDSFLKSETERLKKKVAYLILKTRELVEALKQAGVALPSNRRKRSPKGKLKEPTESLNHQTGNSSITNKLESSLKTCKLSKKKKAKCGCEKKMKLNKKPLTENNSGAVTIATNGLTYPEGECCSSTSSKIGPANLMCKPNDVTVSNNIQTTETATTTETLSTTDTIGPQSVHHPALVHTTDNEAKTINMNKKEISKLGPGTLIFADGRIVNVIPPPVISQLMVKPSLPITPSPAVIFMQSSENGRLDSVVKGTRSVDRKEKFIVPKRREITMTTFVNKVPIPAVKTFRLESFKESKIKKKTTREYKKTLTVPHNLSSSVPVLSCTSSSGSIITSTDISILNKKNQEESRSKCTKNLTSVSGLVNDAVDIPSSGRQAEKEDKLDSYPKDECLTRKTVNRLDCFSEKSNALCSISNEHSIEEQCSTSKPSVSTCKTFLTVPTRDTAKLSSNDGKPVVSNVLIKESCTSSDVNTLCKTTVPILPGIAAKKTLCEPKTSISGGIDCSNTCALFSPIVNPNGEEDIYNNVASSSKTLVQNSLDSQPLTKSKQIETSPIIFNEIITCDGNKELNVNKDNNNSIKDSNITNSREDIVPSSVGNYVIPNSTCCEDLLYRSLSTSETNGATQLDPSVSKAKLTDNHLMITSSCNETLPPMESDLNMTSVSSNSNLTVRPLPKSYFNKTPNESKQMVPTSIACSVSHQYSNTSICNDSTSSKNLDTYITSSNFTTSKNSKATPSVNLVSSYNITDSFVNANALRESFTVGINDVSGSVGPSATFNKPVALSISNTSSQFKTGTFYPVSDACVSNIHSNQKNSSNIKISDMDTSVPHGISKQTTSSCSNTTTYCLSDSKTLTTYTKSTAATSVVTTSKCSSDFRNSDGILNSVLPFVSKSITTFSMNDMLLHDASLPNSAKLTFGVSQVYTTHCNPICSTRTSSNFSVIDAFNTSSSLAKSVNTFTVGDFYNGGNVNSITGKTSLSSTTNNTCSTTTSNSSCTFTMSNISLNKINKSCNQLSSINSSVTQHLPIYDLQQRIASGTLVTSSKSQFSTDENVKKIFTACTAGSDIKGDQCSEFLRTSKDVDKSFVPIIDDVRLSSDFSNDLFNSLQVPSGSHHSESISPTAAFLLAFPLVSTSKSTENMTDVENNENHTTSTPTTILQIGNIEPPSTELFQSMDFGKSKDFEVQTDIDCNKSKQKPKYKSSSSLNQSYSGVTLLPNDYNAQCDFVWSKPAQKKKQEKVQKYHYDCFKQDKKKRKISVNWMTTPENDVYKETEFPSSSSNGSHYNIDMEFSELCNNRKNQTNCAWSPNKSLTPFDNPLMIPSTLPTLVGDLALGTTTPSDPFPRYEKKEKQESKKFIQPKSQATNFLSVSQLVDPKCKKQKPIERLYNKQKQIVTSGSNDKKGQCIIHRDYQTVKRREPNETCMYRDSFVPRSNWDNKHRYKGGSYSAESLIQQQQQHQQPPPPSPPTFNINYQQSNFFPNSEYGHDSGQSNPGQYQNFLNFSQGHFSSCLSEDYSGENFNLTSQPSNHRINAGPIGQGSGVYSSNTKLRSANNCSLRDRRDDTSYPCPNSASAPNFNYYPHNNNNDNHQHHHQQQQQHNHHYQQQPSTYNTTNLQQNFNTVENSISRPAPTPLPSTIPPPVSNYSVTTTSTLANFNLSTIFPEINDQRVGPSIGQTRSHLNTFPNNDSYRDNSSMH